MCRASVQGWHPVASDWYASSLWGKPWTGASHSLPSRSGQSQGPGQPRSSQLRDAELEGSVCAYVCAHVCTHWKQGLVGMATA